MSVQTQTIYVSNLSPPPTRIPMYDKNGIVAPQWLRWWQDIWNRVGGATGNAIYAAANTVNIQETNASGEFQLTFAPGAGPQSELLASPGLKYDPASGTLTVNSISVNSITGGATIIVTSVEQANNANVALLATNVVNPNPSIPYLTMTKSFSL